LFSSRSRHQEAFSATMEWCTVYVESCSFIKIYISELNRENKCFYRSFHQNVVIVLCYSNTLKGSGFFYCVCVLFDSYIMGNVSVSMVFYHQYFFVIIWSFLLPMYGSFVCVLGFLSMIIIKRDKIWKTSKCFSTKQTNKTFIFGVMRDNDVDDVYRRIRT
jgi:hypothetical protein